MKGIDYLKEKAAELIPCPFCGSSNYRIEAGGQTWRGVKGYSEPQYYHLYHNGIIPEGDGFQSCSIQIRARTDAECVAVWNNTRLEGLGQCGGSGMEPTVCEPLPVSAAIIEKVTNKNREALERLSKK